MSPIKAITKSLLSRSDKSHGSWAEANSGWVEPKPYVEYWSNGVFEAEDGTILKYFAFPEDVATEWVSSPEEAIYNQAFLIDLMKDLSAIFDAQTDTTKRDIRRKYHISITQEPVPAVQPYKDAPPAYADYLTRAGEQATKPKWSSYIGFSIVPSDMFYGTNTLKDKVYRYVEMMKDETLVEWEGLRQDLSEINRITAKHGFTSLDFDERPEDFVNLTAWHGVEDNMFYLPRQLQTTNVREPVHGKSIITPRWGEIVFGAVKPKEGVSLSAPAAPSTPFGKAIYRPDSKVVVVSIRGEIRASSVVDNLLELRETSREVKKDPDFARFVANTRRVVQEQKLPMLDNTDIVVAVKVNEDDALADPRIHLNLKPYNLEFRTLVDRQPIALNSTFPGYPRNVMRVPRGNRRRPELSNAMLPGILAFSNLFRAHKSAGQYGFFVGLGDSGDEYTQVMTEYDAANRYSGSPVIGVTGTPGSGKTQQLVNWAFQAAYMGLPCYYLNPKKVGTLKAVFDHIGGITVSLSAAFLRDNPGVIDPMLHLKDREAIASMVAEFVVRIAELQDRGNVHRRATLASEIKDNALDPRNETTRDILFGRREGDRQITDPISDEEVLSILTSRINTSPFWRGFVAPSGGAASDLQRRISSTKSVLFEWDDSMSLPDPEKENPTDTEVDTLLSIRTVFTFAMHNLAGLKGSLLEIDEAWVLNSSPEIIQLLDRAAREWRQSNITLVLGTQKITDFGKEDGDGAGTGLSAFMDRFLCMNVKKSSTSEFKRFFELSGFAPSARIENYLANAKIDKTGRGSKNNIPRAVWVDKFHNWAGGVIAGPWPKLELMLGSTDGETQAIRERFLEGNKSTSDSLTGVLRDAFNVGGRMFDEFDDGDLDE